MKNFTLVTCHLMSHVKKKLPRQKFLPPQNLFCDPIFPNVLPPCRNSLPLNCQKIFASYPQKLFASPPLKCLPPHPCQKILCHLSSKKCFAFPPSKKFVTPPAKMFANPNFFATPPLVCLPLHTQKVSYHITPTIFCHSTHTNFFIISPPPQNVATHPQFFTTPPLQIVMPLYLQKCFPTPHPNFLSPHSYKF